MSKHTQNASLPRRLAKILGSIKVLAALLPTALFALSFVASLVAALMGRGSWSSVLVSGLISAPMVALCWAIVDARRRTLRGGPSE